MPPEVLTSPGNQTVATGNTAVFPCHVTGDPQPTVTWYKSRNPLISDAHFSILPNGTLIVRNVRQQDAGWYTCQARSDAGQVEERAFLIVTGVCVCVCVCQDLPLVNTYARFDFLWQLLPSVWDDEESYIYPGILQAIQLPNSLIFYCSYHFSAHCYSQQQKVKRESERNSQFF